MAFANTEIEALKKKEMASENKIKDLELEDKLLYQEVYNRRENCVSSVVSKVDKFLKKSSSGNY